MEVKRFSCPEEFLRHAEHALLEHEAVNNLPLGLLYHLREQQDSEAVLLSAENEQGIQLMAVMASGELILAGDERRVEAAGELAAYIKKAGIRPPGVIGQPAIAKAFADAWKRKTRVKMKQTIYQLDNVNDVSLSSGSLRKADQRDLELITDWIHSFSEEAFHDGLGHEKAKKMAARGLIKLQFMYGRTVGRLFQWLKNRGRRKTASPSTLCLHRKPAKQRLCNIMCGGPQPDAVGRRGLILQFVHRSSQSDIQ